MFKPEFGGKVISGQKRQTVRPTPKRMPLPGECESWRRWTGKPYRSPQVELAKVIIVSVHDFWFNGVTILLDDPKAEKGLMSDSQQQEIAKADGFINLKEMADWFEKMHGLPFKGILIKAK